MRTTLQSSLMFLALFIAGCGGAKPEALKLNNDVSGVVKELSGLAKKFAEGKGDGKDAAKLKSAHDQAILDIDRILVNAEKIHVPDDAESKTFWAALQQLLKNQEKIVKNDFKDVLDGLANPALKEKADKTSAAMQALEKHDLTNLIQAQQAFAKAKGLRVQ